MTRAPMSPGGWTYKAVPGNANEAHVDLRTGDRWYPSIAQARADGLTWQA